MKTKTLLPLAALAALCLSSCIKDNDTTKTQTLIFTDYFNAVSNSADATSKITTAPKYTIEMTQEGDKVTAKVTMNNIVIDDVAATDFVFPELAVKSNADGSMSITATDIAPTNSTVSGGVIFDRIDLKILQIVIYDVYGNPAVRTAFTAKLNIGDVQIMAIPNTALLFADTESRNMGDNSVFKTSTPRYAITFDTKKMTATIDITGAQFSQKMPAMDMTFASIPFGIGLNGITINTDALTPEIDGTPYPQFPITNLSALYVPFKNSVITFFCEPGQLGKYYVSASLNDNPTLIGQN